MDYSTATNNVGEMSNTDACAIGDAMSMVSDSFSYSSLSDADTTAVKNALDVVCSTVGGGVTTCADLNRDRSACTGMAGDTPSENAEDLVAGINAAWPN